LPEYILLAILKEGSGTAATVLKNLGIDFQRLTTEIKKKTRIIRKARKGIGIETPGGKPWHISVKQVIEFAIEEARSLGHNYVGTEHLLLGLLKPTAKPKKPLARRILLSHGLTYEEVKKEIINILGVGTTDLASRLSPVRTQRAAKPVRCETFWVGTSGSDKELESAKGGIDRFLDGKEFVGTSGCGNVVFIFYREK